MTYNPAIDMPRTLEEFNSCVDYYTNLDAERYQEQCGAVRQNARASYAKLPDKEKPSLEEWLVRAVSFVEKPKERAEFERLYSCYLPQAQPSFEEPAPTVEQLFNMLRYARNEKLKEYDEKISQLNRQIRENPENSEAIAKRAAWDTYANALCNLPAQAGAPWDGGGIETPWPDKPE